MRSDTDAAADRYDTHQPEEQRHEAPEGRMPELQEDEGRMPESQEDRSAALPGSDAPGFSDQGEDRIAEDRGDRPAPEDEPDGIPAPAGAVQPETTLPAEQPLEVWSSGRAEEYRDRWRQVQVRFLDDPRSAAEQAEGLVSEVLDALTQALDGQKRALDGWRSAGHVDTERLRVCVRGYRDLLDRVLTL
jgi:hypothetical protein